MRRTLEVIENLAPLAVVARAAAMTLVHNDEVKKLGTELLVGIGVGVVVGKALIQREVDVVSGINLLVLDDGHRLFEMAEVAANRLVNQRRAVSEEQDAFLEAAFPKTVNDLKCRVSFSRASRHDEQMAVVAVVPSNGFDAAVDGNLLVVARRAI